jgi:hypothetical protein
MSKLDQNCDPLKRNTKQIRLLPNHWSILNVEQI